ncbi:MAG: toll/interleukin-1 receptor domain-containing protein, partial [Anaerolineae bacterium]|nr:toll/interleukin-1 receptor domain-containing protein [Anaerolineae bacterium]
MPKIFISHSSQDNDFAAKLADALRERGAEVWIDLADIPAGMKWSKAIQQGLDWGELMLLIVTSDSMASENVADEWEYYHQKKKPIIPVWRTPAEMPFQLHRLQYVDFHERDFDSALSKLGVELARLGFAFPT